MSHHFFLIIVTLGKMERTFYHLVFSFHLSPAHAFSLALPIVRLFLLFQPFHITPLTANDSFTVKCTERLDHLNNFGDYVFNFGL